MWPTQGSNAPRWKDCRTNRLAGAARPPSAWAGDFETPSFQGTDDGEMRRGGEGKRGFVMDGQGQN